MNGVIETATGDLIRKGNTDFENDGSFDSNTETFMAGIPVNLMVKRVNGGDFSRWNGASWATIAHTPYIVKERGTIMAEVLGSAEPVTQLPRLLDALDEYPSVLASLDNYNYPLAYSRIDKARIGGSVTQADMDMIVSKFPAGWNA